MISTDHPLALGSRSPRRSEILRSLGISIRVCPADAPEVVTEGEDAESYVARVARDKLRAVVGAGHAADAPAILVADTIVVVDGEILGKPEDVSDAERLLGLIVGRAHRVLTRYAIAVQAGGAEPVRERTVESRVFMRSAEADEVRRYAATGEGLDKAGAYAVQGVGAFLIERIEGSYSNVVGLPACEVVIDLKDLGLLGAFPFGEHRSR